MAAQKRVVDLRAIAMRDAYIVGVRFERKIQGKQNRQARNCGKRRVNGVKTLPYRCNPR